MVWSHNAQTARDRSSGDLDTQHYLNARHIDNKHVQQVVN